MKNSLLLVVDVQRNFINENTENLISKLSALIQNNNYNYVAFTKFINDENSNFYKSLNYKGCMNEYDREIVIETKDYRIFNKRTYTALTNELKDYLKEKNIDIVYLCGIETDACIFKTALDLFDNNYNFKVLKDYCMSHSSLENHNMAIHLLERLIGKDNII